MLARDLIILDDQNAKPRGSAAPDRNFVIKFPERPALDRLGHVFGGTERVTPVLLIDDGEHHDGDIRELTIRLQFLQDAPAVAARHLHVEGDECRLHLPGQFQGFRTVLGRHYIATLADEKPAHLVPHRLIVINDEDHVRDDANAIDPPRPRKQEPAALHGYRSAFRARVDCRRQPHGERGADARSAVDGDAATHHAAQALADGKPQPGAAVLAASWNCRPG